MSSDFQPLVSIIIPCYNYGTYLPESIGSILKQTYKNWECIIVDDGSTDNSKEVADALCAKDKRINYVFQENAGPTVARNNGLRNAKGEFIQFLDADDLIENQKIEKQLELFEKNADSDIVYGNVKYFKSNASDQLYNDITLEGSKPWMKKISGCGDTMILALLRGNLMVIQSPLFRKSLIDKFGAMDETLFYNEDWELWARFAINNAKFQFDESVNTNSLVRVHDSYSNDKFKMFVHGLHVCLKMNKILKGRKYKKILIPKIAYHERIIDEQLISALRVNKEEAVAKAAVVELITGLERYKKYTSMFNIYPVWFCYLYSKFLFLINKLKNVIIYA